MGSYDAGHGMEHPLDHFDIPPLFSEDLMSAMRSRVAAAWDRGEKAAAAWATELGDIAAFTSALDGKARLSRLVLLGHPDAPAALSELLLPGPEEGHGHGGHSRAEKHPGGKTAHDHGRAAHARAGHGAPELPRHFSLAPVLDVLSAASCILPQKGLRAFADSFRGTLEALADRFVALVGRIAAADRLLLIGGSPSSSRPAVHSLLDGLDVCCSLSDLFSAWEKSDPFRFFAEATEETAHNAVLGRAEPTPAGGRRVLLTPRGARRFSKERPEGVEVVFSPGVMGKVVQWTPRRILVEAPEAALSGPVRFGIQLTAAKEARLASRRHDLSHAAPADFPLSLLGIRAPQTLLWPPLAATRPNVKVRFRLPPKVADLTLYDAKGRRVPAGQALQDDTPGPFTLTWKLEGEAAALPLEVLLNGKTYMKRPPLHPRDEGHADCPGRHRVPLDGDLPAGLIETLILEIDPSIARHLVEVRVGDFVGRLDLFRWIRFEVFPKVLQVSWGRTAVFLVRLESPASEEFRLRAAFASGRLDFLPRPGESGDVFTFRPGETWGAFTVRHPGGDDPRGPAPGTPDDTLIFSSGSGERWIASGPSLPVWVGRPAGRWEAPLVDVLGLVGVHAVLLHTGKVLYFSFAGESLAPGFADLDRGLSQLFDPATGTAAPPVEIGRNLFCAAQSVLPDGRVYAPGGQNPGGAAPERGEAWRWIGDLSSGAMADTHVFDPASGTWSRHADMNEGRYYPTSVILPDGNALVAGGLSNLIAYVIAGNAQNNQFEIFDGTNLIERNKFRTSDQYPVIQVIPGTTLLFVHIKRDTYFFDLSTRLFWQMPAEFFGDFGATQDFKIRSGAGRQTYPAQTGMVMLPLRVGGPIRFFCVGGSRDENPGGESPALRSGFIFQFDAADPRASRWRETRGRPAFGRILDDAVLLPDGKVLVVNGAAMGHANDPSSPVFQPEIFDPDTERFTLMASADPMHPRMYHSTSVLLPDGRVAIAGHTRLGNTAGTPGSVDDRSVEIFNPPYLFAGPRPVVAAAPESVAYGDTFRADVSPAEDVNRAVLVRPAAVTHSVDMNQRLIQLDVTARGFDFLALRAPADGTMAPPGFYMLFFISRLGVPSVARFIRLS